MTAARAHAHHCRRIGASTPVTLWQATVTFVQRARQLRGFTTMPHRRIHATARPSPSPPPAPAAAPPRHLPAHPLRERPPVHRPPHTTAGDRPVPAPHSQSGGRPAAHPHLGSGDGPDPHIPLTEHLTLQERRAAHPHLARVWRLVVVGLVAVLGAAVVPVPAFAAGEGRGAVVGVPGLEWSDIDESRTPNLWKLAGQGATASLSTRAVPPPGRGITCPVAGWLTVSAGQRAGTPGPGCPETPSPLRDGRGATVPGWADLVAHQAGTGYDARLGTLAQTVVDGGGEVAAVGPGAALAAADSAGRVAAYGDTPAELGDLSSYTLIVMDVPDLATAWAAQPADGYGVPTAMPPEARQQAAADADRRIGAFLAALPPGTTVLVAGISDVSPGAHLHVAIAAGDRYPAGHLTAGSTRQEALVAIQDVAATAIHLTGLEPPRQVVGRPWQPGGPGAPTAGDRVADLADADLASQVLMQVRGPFFSVFVAVQLLFYAFAALALRRRRSATPTGTTGAQAPATDPDRRTPS